MKSESCSKGILWRMRGREVDESQIAAEHSAAELRRNQVKKRALQLAAGFKNG